VHLNGLSQVSLTIVHRPINSAFVSHFRHKNTVGSAREPVICLSKRHDCTHNVIKDIYVHVEDMGVGTRNMVVNFEVGPEVNTLTRRYLIRDQDGQSDVAKRLDSKPNLQISQRWRVNVLHAK